MGMELGMLGRMRRSRREEASAGRHADLNVFFIHLPEGA